MDTEKLATELKDAVKTFDPTPLVGALDPRVGSSLGDKALPFFVGLALFVLVILRGIGVIQMDLPALLEETQPWWTFLGGIYLGLNGVKAIPKKK